MGDLKAIHRKRLSNIEQPKIFEKENNCIYGK